MLSKKSTKASFSNNFIEHFFLFGLDWSDLFNKDNSINQIKGNTSISIKPKLLTKFPPINKPNTNINSEVIMNHCFPDGFELSNSNTIKEPELFFFSLENLPSIANYPRIYFSCLLIYELFSCFDLFSSLDTNLASENKKESKIIDNEVLMKKNWVLTMHWYEKNQLNKAMHTLIPKALCFASLSPFPREHGWLLKKIVNYTNTIVSLPIEKIIENIVMEIPFPQRKMTKIIYTFPNNINNASVKAKDSNNQLTISQDPMNQLLVPSYSMEELISLEIPSILTIFNCLLLEVPVLFFSSKMEFLTTVFETFISLLHPLVFQYPHVSILPINNYGSIDIYDSFAFGINKDYTKDFFKVHNLRVFKKHILIVDLKTKSTHSFYQDDQRLPLINLIELGSYINNINIEKNATPITEIELPGRYVKKLNDRMKELFVAKAKPNSKLTSDKFNHDLKNCFYYFFLSILNKYASYLILDKEGTNEEKPLASIMKKKSSSLEAIFKYEEYVQSFKGNDQSFYVKLFATKMFYDFIAKRYLPRTTEESLTILHFDESCIGKKNKKMFAKKIETNFLNTKMFIDKPEEYKVPLARDFTEEEKEHFFKSNNVRSAITYFQITNINYNPNQFESHNDKTKKVSYYAYPVFPKLLYDNVFFNSQPYEKICLKNNLSRNDNLHFSFATLCSKILDESKYTQIYSDIGYSLSFDKEVNFEFENCIFLLWLSLFANCLWYCDETERYYRFFEMLENLKKTKYIRKDVISLLYASVDQYGNEKMLIKLYEEISNLGFSPCYTEFAYLINKLTCNTNNEKMIKKKLSVASSRVSITFYQKSEEEAPEDEKEFVYPHFRKRTIAQDKHYDNESEELLYETESICSYCQKTFDLRVLSLKFSCMNKEYEMGLCPLCNKQIRPLVKVMLPEKTIESFNMCSPYYLYTKFVTNILNEYGLKLDLDVFRKLYPKIYWNTIWYFTMKGLSLELLLKYKEDYPEDGDDNNSTRLSNEFNSLEIERQVVNVSYLSKNNTLSRSKSQYIKKDSLAINFDDESEGSLGEDNERKERKLTNE